MYIAENLKRAFERVTGRAKPSKKEARSAVRKRKPRTIKFKDGGWIPNNPKLPFVVFKNVVRLDNAPDPAAVFEQLFAANGWNESWRNGVYPFVHYHSSIHEVLGIARGHACVQFGGPQGKKIAIAAGDVAILPAGTGHQCFEASDDFLVVGAYPPTGKYDLCRGKPEEHERALKSIPRVPAPKTDPVYGKEGPLVKLWRK